MLRKEDVSFPAEGGIELSAWLFVPEDGPEPLPAITMARGSAGNQVPRHRADGPGFRDAGFAVSLHDHRGFGDSGGAAAGRGG